jgi:hypothetical protein
VAFTVPFSSILTQTFFETKYSYVILTKRCVLLTLETLLAITDYRNELKHIIPALYDNHRPHIKENEKCISGMTTLEKHSLRTQQKCREEKKAWVYKMINLKTP